MMEKVPPDRREKDAFCFMSAVIGGKTGECTATFRLCRRGMSHVIGGKSRCFENVCGTDPDGMSSAVGGKFPKTHVCPLLLGVC